MENFEGSANLIGVQWSGSSPAGSWGFFFENLDLCIKSNMQYRVLCFTRVLLMET